MKNNIVAISKSLIVPGVLSMGLLMTGCGGTFGDDGTDEAKQYEVAMAIDSGDYDKAIAMLEADCAGYAYEECQLNLGTAYLAKAGYDITTIGREMLSVDGNDLLTQDQKDRELTTIILSKMLDDSMAEGVDVLKNGLLDGNTTQCTPQRYGAMTDIKKQGCLAVNPIMLKDLMSDEPLDAADDTVVSLEMIVAFADVAESLIPGMETEEFVAIVNGGDDLDPKYDVNGNTEVDSIEVTACIMDAYSTGVEDFTVCDSTNAPDKNITLTQLINDQVITGYGTFDIIEANVSGEATAQNDKIQIRLVSEGVIDSTVTTTDKFVDADGNYVTTCVDPELGSTCFPEPKKDDSGTVETSAQTVVDVLNNDDLLSTIAETTGSEEGTTADDLRIEICASGYPDDNTTDLCADDDLDGDIDINIDAFLDYASRDK